MLLYLARSLTCALGFLFLIFFLINRESIRSLEMVGEYCRKKCLFYILYVLFKNNNNNVSSFGEVKKKLKTSIIYI